MAFWDSKLISVFNGATNFIDITEINMWINSVGNQVHSKGDKTNISGALTVAKERSFDAIGSS